MGSRAIEGTLIGHYLFSVLVKAGFILPAITRFANVFLIKVRGKLSFIDKGVIVIAYFIKDIKCTGGLCICSKPVCRPAIKSKVGRLHPDGSFGSSNKSVF
ncbi:hypothetical protein D9M68_792540 [compost metagenome]